MTEGLQLYIYDKLKKQQGPMVNRHRALLSNPVAQYSAGPSPAFPEFPFPELTARERIPIP